MLFKMLPMLLRARSLKKVKEALLQLARRDGPIAWGAFLGSFFCIFETLIRRLSVKSEQGPPLSRSARAALAGGVAGFAAILCLPKSSRGSMSAFIVVRALEIAARYMVEDGFLPSVPHADTLTMMAASAMVLYLHMMHPTRLMDSSYHRFLCHHGGKPWPLILHFRQGMGGAPTFKADSMVPEEVQAQLKALMEKGLLPRVDLNPANVDAFHRLHHPASSNCDIGLLNFVYEGMFRAYPVYLPVYLLPLLLFKWRSLLRDPLPLLLKTTFGVARSSLFLSLYCGLCWRMICMLHRVGWRHRFSGALMGMAGGSALLLENKPRRMELALLVLSHALTGAHGLLREKGMFPTVPLGTELVFALSTAMMMHSYLNRPQHLRPSYFGVLSFFFGSGGRNAGFPKNQRARVLSDATEAPPQLNGAAAHGDEDKAK